ncbi:MAG: hypothetical protein AAFX78_05045 [Cyanobacteria bacterium J06638_20]
MPVLVGGKPPKKKKPKIKAEWWAIGLGIPALLVMLAIASLDEPVPEVTTSPEVTPQDARRELIEDQFSPWDGSHNELTRIIKRSMNDPRSYEHVETRYIDNGDHLMVITQFRGSNAFGGIVINSVTAKVDLDGNVFEDSVTFVR